MTVASWFSKIRGDALEHLDDLLLAQLRDLYDAEERLIKALPTMEEAAHAPSLKTAFRLRLEQTKEHRNRLEQAFRELGQPPKAETCEAMKGLIAEGSEVAGLSGDPTVKDAALIAAAQRVEHYEIAGYGRARTFARQLGRDDVAQILKKTLDEEVDTDARLTELAENFINPVAAAK
jgi:ferritin-like metal-binding protein YciE